MDIDKVIKILRAHQELEEKVTKSKIASFKHENLPASIGNSKEKILKKIELHIEAEKYLESETLEYKRSLHQLSMIVANSELEKDVITKSHVRKAKEILWKKKNKFSFYDGMLSVGSLLLGLFVTNAMTSFEGTTKISYILLILGLIGAVMLGVGANGKAQD